MPLTTFNFMFLFLSNERPQKHEQFGHWCQIPENCENRNDIILLSETHLNDDIVDGDIQIKGYQSPIRKK
jgi:hypothetical protein